MRGNGGVVPRDDMCFGGNGRGDVEGRGGRVGAVPSPEGSRGNRYDSSTHWFSVVWQAVTTSDTYEQGGNETQSCTQCECLHDADLEPEDGDHGEDRDA